MGKCCIIRKNKYKNMGVENNGSDAGTEQPKSDLNDSLRFSLDAWKMETAEFQKQMDDLSRDMELTLGYADDDPSTSVQALTLSAQERADLNKTVEEIEAELNELRDILETGPSVGPGKNPDGAEIYESDFLTKKDVALRIAALKRQWEDAAKYFRSVEDVANTTTVSVEKGGTYLRLTQGRITRRLRIARGVELHDDGAGNITLSKNDESGSYRVSLNQGDIVFIPLGGSLTNSHELVKRNGKLDLLKKKGSEEVPTVDNVTAVAKEATEKKEAPLPFTDLMKVSKYNNRGVIQMFKEGQERAELVLAFVPGIKVEAGEGNEVWLTYRGMRGRVALGDPNREENSLFNSENDQDSLWKDYKLTFHRAKSYNKTGTLLVKLEKKKS